MSSFIAHADWMEMWWPVIHRCFIGTEERLLFQWCNKTWFAHLVVLSAWRFLSLSRSWLCLSGSTAQCYAEAKILFYMEPGRWINLFVQALWISWELLRKFESWGELTTLRLSYVKVLNFSVSYQINLFCILCPLTSHKSSCEEKFCCREQSV